MKKNEEIFNVISDLLGVANYYMDTYCDLVNEYVLPKEEIEKIEYPEYKERALELYKNDQILEKADKFLDEFRDECMQKLVDNCKEAYRNNNLDKASLEWCKLYSFCDNIKKNYSFEKKQKLLEPFAKQFSDKEVYDITDNLKDIEYWNLEYKNYPKLNHSKEIVDKINEINEPQNEDKEQEEPDNSFEEEE